MTQGQEGFIPFLIEVVRSTVGDGTFSEQHTEQIARQIVTNYGGIEVYIPKVDPLRRERVLRKFNGRNRKEVCEQEGLSKSQFYEILKGG